MNVTREQVALLEFLQFLILEALEQQNGSTIELLSETLALVYQRLMPCNLDAYYQQLRTLSVQFDKQDIITPEYLAEFAKRLEQKNIN